MFFGPNEHDGAYLLFNLYNNNNNQHPTQHTTSFAKGLQLKRPHPQQHTYVVVFRVYIGSL
jgi:hypothetical protein